MLTYPVADTSRVQELAGEALGRTVDANPDMKKFYHYGPENWPDDPYFTGRRDKLLSRIWPDEPATFRAASIAYYEEMNAWWST